MKRSEAIKALSRRCICPHVVLYEGIEKIFESKAESILNFVEKELGMAPPESTVDRVISRGKAVLKIDGKDYPAHDVVFKMPLTKNQWEPENEEE